MVGMEPALSRAKGMPAPSVPQGKLYRHAASDPSTPLRAGETAPKSYYGMQSALIGG